MENRKLIKALIPVLILGFFITYNTVFAYSVETHAFLTDEIIKFYNQHFSGQQISYELKNYLIDGSRREDDAPRWMNHFYDPVYERGLTYDPAIDPLINLGTWQKSKEWAQDSNNQNNLTYKVPATIASILTAIQQQKISVLTTETDFTWQRAIKFYAQGDKEKAMFMLGHILHLIEDKAVPDHTRNDPHPENSPYEGYTKNFNLSNPDNSLSKRLVNKSPIMLSGLNSYFDELAKYSNNNFYSKDTIGIQSGYENPQPNFTNYKIINGLYYILNKDSGGEEYFLIVKKSLKNLVITTNSDVSIDNQIIKDSYWSRLSIKSVQYGAGVINLFFQEAEKAKNDPNFAKTEEKSIFAKAADAVKNLFGQVGNFFSGIFGAGQDFQEVGQVTLEQSIDAQPSQAENQSPKSEVQAPPKTDVESPKVSQQNQPQENQLAETEENKEVPQQEEIQQATTTLLQTTSTLPQTANFKQCSFQTNQSPSRQKVLINEVAWMGTAASANDEWIELKNISGSEIDLTGWQLIDQGEQIKINLGFIYKTKILAGGFILLERTDDNSVPNITADLIYTGILSNTNEGLRLFDSQCNLIDEALASPDWPAGDNSAKKTMERKSDFSWYTSSVVGGTPKRENSTPTVISSGGGGGAVSTDNQQSPAKILISEIQITGGTGKTENDFIELYNPNNFQVNLNGYRLVKRTKTGSSDTSIKSWTTDVYIPANGYYLWANSGYTDIPATPDITTTATISNDNGVAIRFGAADTGTIIDSVGWGEAQNAFIETTVFPTNLGVNQSIQRKFQNNTFVDTDNNASDFEIQACPNPKAQSRDCQLGAVQDFNITYSSNTMELIFNWQSPPDYYNSTSSLTYRITEITNVSSTLPDIETTSTAARVSINEVGRDYQFSIRAFDNNLGLVTSTASITVPSFFSGLYFYQNPQTTSSSPEYFIDLYYDNYPFIPQKYNSNISGLVFYLNQESPPAPQSLNLGGLFGCLYGYATMPEAAKIYYPNYSFSYSHSSGTIVALPNILEPIELYNQLYGGLPGGIYQYIINRDQLEDNHLRVLARENFTSTPTSQDYLKIAFYSYTTARASCEQVLVAINQTKYYFQENFPFNNQFPSSPTTPTNFQVAFQQQSENPYFLASWATSTDPDSLDQEIIYHLDYWPENNPSDKQQLITGQNSVQINVSISGNYIFELKAGDEFNLYSETASASSTAFIPVALAETSSGSYNPIGFGGGNPLGPNLVQKIAQVFTLAQKARITSFKIGLANSVDYYNNPSGAKISLRPAEGGLPSEQEIISFSLRPDEIPRYNTYVYGNGVKEFSFFPSSINELNPGVYFLVIEPENYPIEGFWNLVTLYSGNDSYLEGGLYYFYQTTNQWSGYDTRDINFRVKGFVIE